MTGSTRGRCPRCGPHSPTAYRKKCYVVEATLWSKVVRFHGLLQLPAEPCVRYTWG